MVLNVQPEHKPNRKGGYTVAVKKTGGWSVAFALAKDLAGWHEAAAAPIDGQ